MTKADNQGVTMTNIARLVTSAAVAVALPLGMTTMASASPAATYHGTFTQVVYTPVHGSPTVKPAAGTWNVSVRGSSIGTATFNLFVDGVHHLAYGVPGQAVTRTQTGWTFELPTLAGEFHVTLAGGTLTYDIPDYSLNGTSYADVTYTGQLGR